MWGFSARVHHHFIHRVGTPCDLAAEMKRPSMVSKNDRFEIWEQNLYWNNGTDIINRQQIYVPVILMNGNACPIL